MGKPAPLYQQRRTEIASRDLHRDLQPVLLDRLTDHDAQKAREADGAFLLTRTALRDSVLRDLRWLMNTTNSESTDDLAPFPQARNSVVNFGIGALAGQRMSEVEWPDIESAIRESILHFEPRILAENLELRCLSESTELEHNNMLALEIRGQLWSIPYPTEFIFRSKIDLESGYIALHSLGNS